nr:uncharacterized protein LOC107384615 isoform X2 [Nothobranchius furzeri]
MSELWTFLAAAPPNVHHSSLSPSLPPLSFRNHGNHPPAKVSGLINITRLLNSCRYGFKNVTSPHTGPPQVTSPNLAFQTQVASFQYPQSQVTSPHLQTPPSHLFYQPHTTSPHLPLPKVYSPQYLAPPQVNSPPLPDPRASSPGLGSQHQNLLYNQNPDLDYPNWTRCEPTSDLSCLQNGFGFSYQNQTAAHMDLHLQDQTQFGTGETAHRDELENTNKLYGSHAGHVSSTFEQSDIHELGQHTWIPSQVQCSPLGSPSAGGTEWRWSSTELSSASAEDFPNNHFFSESYNENNNQQPFSSPSTPGPSPHYPLTPAVSSPGPQIHPRTVFTKQPNDNHTSDYCLNEPSSFFMPPGLGLIHQTSQQQLMTQTTQTQDLKSFLKAAETSSSSQERGQSLGHPAGLTHKEEGGGRRKGSRKRDQDPLDWNWVKRIKPEKSTEALNSRCRLLCVVCNREFKSLPALNGHMRSHSGSRSPKRPKKETSPPTPSQVSIPVHRKGTSGLKGCSLLPLSNRGAALYHSLMRQKEKEEAKPVANKVAKTADYGQYTPPLMLCPQREGPGLYCSLTTRRQQRAQTVQLYNELGDLVAITTSCPPSGQLAWGTIAPRINLGRSFQAEIPPLRDEKYAQTDSHNALLLWMPCDELENPASQQRIEFLLKMVQSSVVPESQAGPEHALQLLSESKGDFLLTVETLLEPPETSNNQTGVRWSSAEKKLLMKSFQLHQKDFSRIQRSVRTKSLSNCVEFYYLWKKKLSLNMKTRAELTFTQPDVMGEKNV